MSASAFSATARACVDRIRCHALGVDPNCPSCKSLGGHAIKVYPDDAQRLLGTIELLAAREAALVARVIALEADATSAQREINRSAVERDGLTIENAALAALKPDAPAKKEAT